MIVGGGWRQSRAQSGSKSWLITRIASVACLENIDSSFTSELLNQNPEIRHVDANDFYGLTRVKPGNTGDMPILGVIPRGGLQAEPSSAGGHSLEIRLCLSCWALFQVLKEGGGMGVFGCLKIEARGQKH